MDKKKVFCQEILRSKSIQRNLRSMINFRTPGYGESGRYFSELGVKTMRDGSLSLTESDFNKAFEREPILLILSIQWLPLIMLWFLLPKQVLY